MSDTGHGRFVLRAFLVALAAFLVVLGVAGGVYILALRGSVQSGAYLAGAAETGKEGPRSALFENVPLLENYQFTAALAPLAGRSVTFEYTITLRILKSERQRLDQLLDPNEANMKPVIQESIRKIIGKEDYLKLRSEQLEDVKRRIRQELNTLLNGEVVEDVIFDKWNVIP